MQSYVVSAIIGTMDSSDSQYKIEFDFVFSLYKFLPLLDCIGSPQFRYRLSQHSDTITPREECFKSRVVKHSAVFASQRQARLLHFTKLRCGSIHFMLRTVDLLTVTINYWLPSCGTLHSSALFYIPLQHTTLLL